MDEFEKRFDEAAGFLTPNLRRYLLVLPGTVKRQVSEIRLRNNGPLVLTGAGGAPWFLNKTGQISEIPGKEPLSCSPDELLQCFHSLCSYSVHTHQREIIEGYLSLRGGHRAGIAGSAVIDGGKVVSVKEISSVNLRIAREVTGASDMLRPLFCRGARGVLIAGKPASGKTTLLRDLARQLSNGNFGRMYRVLAVDERGELAAMSNGRPHNDLGYNCDVIRGFPKAEAVTMGVRSLSPEVVVCDEIGSAAEARALGSALNCGVAAVASVHAASRQELFSKEWIMPLIQGGVFENIVILEEKAKVREIVRAGELCSEISGNCHHSANVRDGGTYIFTKAETPVSAT